MKDPPEIRIVWKNEKVFKFKLEMKRNKLTVEQIVKILLEVEQEKMDQEQGREYEVHLNIIEKMKRRYTGMFLNIFKFAC